MFTCKGCQTHIAGKPYEWVWGHPFCTPGCLLLWLQKQGRHRWRAKLLFREYGGVEPRPARYRPEPEWVPVQQRCAACKRNLTVWPDGSGRIACNEPDCRLWGKTVEVTRESDGVR